MWRTPPMASPSVPNAGWCRRCTRPVAGRWSPSAWWPATATRCCPAAAAASYCLKRAGTGSWWRPPPGQPSSGCCCRPRSAARTWPGGGLPMPDVVDLIRAKRDARRLADGEIRWLIDAYTGGAIADEQMSALLMAICIRGLDPAELRSWTAAMIESGERLDLRAVPAPTVDKHSTGGVGDKVSLVLAPLVASCGAAVPQLSGRGLGHTGGTLDKLESIPGWRAELTNDEMISVLRAAGCVICAAGQGLAPADRKLYALRDVTGTVESIPLIASSIMSKKIAEGTAALVLDVKVGSGAFMRDIEEARLLAQTMVMLGEEHGVRTTALLTRMDTPLGLAVGNSVEVEEAVAMLTGGGPPDLAEVTLALAAEMLALAGIAADAAGPLAAGRARKEDPVSPAAGVICLAKPGDRVERGQPLLELRAGAESRFAAAREALAGAIEIGPARPAAGPLVLERIGG